MVALIARAALAAAALACFAAHGQTGATGGASTYQSQQAARSRSNDRQQGRRPGQWRQWRHAGESKHRLDSRHHPRGTLATGQQGHDAQKRKRAIRLDAQVLMRPAGCAATTTSFRDSG